MTEVVEQVELDGGVLVGHDGSPASGKAVRYAAQLAGRLGCTLHVLRAWSITTAPKPASQQLGYVAPLSDFEAAVRDDLAADVARLDLGAAEVRLHVGHGGSARQLLLGARGAEMVVVGRRGEGGFRGLGFGSTADQVVRHAPCPVVVVPVAPDER
ncbi:MAG TPA: universal stress protein [Nocardioides sp.]|nr:universal stress protein [Nocardioides sp.]